MIKKTYVKSRKVWKVVFELPKDECPQGIRAKRVSLTGDFNNWKKSATPMKLQDGAYTTTVELDPGHEYQFRYLINGKVWCNDWHADAYVPNTFGGDNCIANLPLVESPKAEGKA